MNSKFALEYNTKSFSMLSKSLHTEMKLTFGHSYRNEYRMRYEMVKWNFYRENDLNYISGLCFVDSTVSLYTAE